MGTKKEGIHLKDSRSKLEVKLMVYIKGGPISSIKGLTVIILAFADHTRSLLNIVCLQSFKNVKPVLAHRPQKIRPGNELAYITARECGVFLHFS